LIKTFKSFRNVKTNQSVTYTIAVASITGTFIFIFHGK